MKTTGRRGRPPLRLAAGLAAGFLTGVALLGAGVYATAGEARPTRGSGGTGLRDVLHSPPLLVERSEAVSLRYEAVCQADELGAPCPVRGTLFVRDLGERLYRRIQLQAGRGSTLSATLSAGLTNGAGFAYYAEIEDGLGGSKTVPAGGALGPQRAWVADRAARIDLGAHAFGRTRAPSKVVVSAGWGKGAAAFGLLTGRELVRIGPSAFDVAPDGSVVVLDQVNDRLAVYPAGTGAPRHLAIPFTGGEGDLAMGGDGAIHVLDNGAEPAVRSFSASGAMLATAAVDRGADMLRATPSGPVLHGYPGDMWFPLRRGVALLQPSEQARGARSGLVAGDGSEILVRGGPREAMFAVARGDRVARAWRVVSETDLGEIQLAEPFGEGLLVVLRVWGEARAEFVALVLSDAGLAQSFSIDAVEWAESAALSRFRLDRGTLYQLRSAPTGVEIVTFDLGGAR